MKILHVIPSIDPRSGGPSKALLTMAKLSKSLGNSVTVVCTNEGKGSSVYTDHLNELNDNCTVHSFTYIGKHSFKLSLHMRFWLKKHIHEYDVVHIHAAFSLMTNIAAQIAHKAQVPYVFRPLGTLAQKSISHKNRFLKRAYFSLVEQKTLDNASCIHVTSLKEEQELHEITKTNIAVIPVFSNTKVEFRSLERLKDLKNIKIGTLGRVHSKKQIELIIDSLPELNSSLGVTGFMIAGDGDPSYILQLKTRAKELRVEHLITWCGFITGEEKQRFFDDLDIYVSPSIHENFGIASVEAMKDGIPCVLSKNIEFVDHRDFKFCYFCDSNSRSLIEGINSWISMENDSRQSMLKSAQSHIKEKFGASHIAELLNKMYQDALLH